MSPHLPTFVAGVASAASGLTLLAIALAGAAAHLVERWRARRGRSRGIAWTR